MTDLTGKTPFERRIMEQLKTLVGERGATGDRAVRLSEILDIASPVWASALTTIDNRAKLQIASQINVSTGTIRRVVKEARQEAEAAAGRAEAAMTRIDAVNAAIDIALDGLDDDIAALTASLSDLSDEIDTELAALGGALDDLSDEIDASIAGIDATIDALEGVVDANYAELSADIGDVAADLATNYYTGVEVDGEISTAVAALEVSLSSDIDAVAADLSTNYYTITETDGEITSAISALDTSLQAEIDDLGAYLDSTFYTAVETDGEISTAVAALETSLSSDIDAVAADLSSNYYTAAEVDGEISTAIAAIETSLSSDIDAVAADLAANYYTSVETDSEISTAVAAAQTTLQTNIDDLEAYLDSTFYTSVETDGEIASAVAALETTLSVEIDGVAADLAANYYTEVETDAAIAAIETSLQATIDGVADDLADFETYVGATYATSVDLDSAVAGVEQVIRSELNRSTPPTGFTSGATAWTSDSGGAPEAVADPNVSWDFADDAAQQDLPTSTTGAMLATKGAIPVSDGDTCRITVTAIVTGTGAGTDGVEFTFTWLDAAFAVGTLVATQSTEDLAPGSIVTLVATATAPADAFWLRGGVAFDGNAYASGADVEVMAIKVENLMSITEIVAGISATFYTKVQTDSAIATGIETYDAEVDGGLSATVTEAKVAMADLNGAVARFTVLVSAGPGYNAAGIEVLAWDDEDAAGTAVRLLGDEVHVPGSLTIGGALTVTDGSGELLPNWNFASGDLRGWDASTGSDGEVVLKEAGYDGLSTANSLYVLMVPAGAGLHVFDAQPLPCAPGQIFAASFEAALGGTEGGAAAILRLRFYSADDTLLQTDDITASLADDTWDAPDDAVTAPAATAYVVASLRLTPPATYPLYATNVSFFRKRTGATLITPNSITSGLVTTGELITLSAQIASGIITSVKIADAAITSAKIGDAEIGNAKLSGDIWSDNYAEDGGGNPTAGFKLKRDTGVIKGVAFVDRDGLLGGAVSDVVTDVETGLIYTYSATWTQSNIIALGPGTGDEFWIVSWSGWCKRVNPSYIAGGNVQISRRIKRSSTWGSWEIVASISGGSAAAYNTFIFHSWSENVCGVFDDYEVKVEAKLNTYSGSPPALLTTLCEDFALGYQAVRK